MFVHLEVVADDLDATDDEALLEGVAQLERMRARIDAAEGRVLAELERRATCDAVTGLPTGAWLAREAHLPSAVARQRVRVGSMLALHFPLVAEALERGHISWDHARVICDMANPRIVDVVAENQELLLALAAGCRFDPWRAEVLALGRLWDQDGGYDPARDPARARLTHGRTIDGLTSLAATLIGTDGELVTQAIEQRADLLYRRAVADHEACPELVVPSRAALRANAMIELIREALGRDIASSRPARAEVALVVEADDPDKAFTPDGVRLADGTTRTVLCDADWFPLVVDSLGVPLDLGRRMRWASDSARRAIRTRDGGCAFPGCDAPVRWCDAHHCVHWEHGGCTNGDNLLCLCRHHHGVVHRDGWSVRLDRDGWAVFQTPSGVGFWGQRRGRRRTGAPPNVVVPPSPPPDVYPGRFHRPEDPYAHADARQRMLSRLRASHCGPLRTR